MRFIFSVILFAFICSSTNAQGKLIICSEYKQDGSYTGVYNNWFINKKGNFMYLFYESSTAVSDTVFVKLDKQFNRRDSNYYELDHYYLIPSGNKKWAANKYIFTKPGKYRISAYNRNGDLLTAPYYTTISFAENEYDDLFLKDSWYYESSIIEFYEKAIGDSMIGKNDVFNYQPNNTNITLYILQQNKKPLQSQHLFVSVYSDDKLHEHISSYPYYIDASWHWTFLPVKMERKGKFIVEIYNDDDVFINSAKIEIR